MGVACWFPMGLRDERIVRLAAREASLLNSRCAVSWQCNADDGYRSGSLQSASSAHWGLPNSKLSSSADDGADCALPAISGQDEHCAYLVS